MRQYLDANIFRFYVASIGCRAALQIDSRDDCLCGDLINLMGENDRGPVLACVKLMP